VRLTPTLYLFRSHSSLLRKWQILIQFATLMLLTRISWVPTLPSCQLGAVTCGTTFSNTESGATLSSELPTLRMATTTTTLSRLT